MSIKEQVIASFENTYKKALNTRDLRILHRQLPEWAEKLIRDGHSGIDVTAQMSEWHDQIIGLVLKWSEEKIKKEENSALPRYCWLSLGSGGRREATFWTDQDNALLYEGDEVMISLFAQWVVEGLTEAGYPPCEGNVMATNPRWRGNMEQWNERLKSWTREADFDHARFAIIASDARPIGGDLSLYRRWRKGFQSLLRQDRRVLMKEANRPNHRRVPLGLFGRIYTKSHGLYAGMVDIKQGGYLQLIESLRLWSLYLDTPVYSTKDRLIQVAEACHWSEKEKNEIKFALEIFLRWRLWIHGRMKDGLLKEADNHLDPKQLKKQDRKALIKAMRIAASLRKDVHHRMALNDGWL